MDVGLRHHFSKFTNSTLSGFNPCFSGCWSSTHFPTSLNAIGVKVSILVLVDVGLRLQSIIGVCRLVQVSILVLVDVGLRPGDTLFIGPAHLLFQSLF